jgi:predicted RND superfamily exporter protein
METVFDEYLYFPADSYVEKDLDKLSKLLGGTEAIEEAFDIEFSCGDKKYLTDMWEFSENGDSLHAVVSDEVLLQYDGNVCTLTPPRDRKTKEVLKEGKQYRFTIKYSREDQEVVAYIDNKERGSFHAVWD